MDNFYLTIPSTATVGNTQSSFITHLVQPIQLTGSWEVGLAEAHIFHAWNNIDKSNNSFMIEYDSVQESTVKFEHFIRLKPGTYKTHNEITTGLESQIPNDLKGTVKIRYTPIPTTDGNFLNAISVECDSKWTVSLGKELRHYFQREQLLNTRQRIFYQTENLNFPLTFGPQCYILLSNKEVKKETVRKSEVLQIPVGWYDSPNQLFSAIKNAIPKHHREKVQLYLKPDDTVTVTTKSPLKIKFSDGMRDMMGFVQDESTGKYPLELRRGVYGIYVYTDIITPQIVGNAYAPLLRVIPVVDNSESKQKLIVHIYDRPDYYPLSRNSFESVEFYLRTESGDPIAFRSGKTLMKLHFRRVR